MAGTGELRVMFEGEGGWSKIAKVAPVFNLVVARRGTSTKSLFGAVNGLIEWKFWREAAVFVMW